MALRARDRRYQLFQVALTFMIGSGMLMTAPAFAAAQESSRIENILVIGSRYQASELQTPQAVSQIQASRIAERAYRTTPQALSHQPGVMVQKTAHGQGSPFIRGLTGKQVLILVDGMRLNNSTFRFGPNQYLSTVPVNVIERLEVLRGPAAALYGSDALGGVINLITSMEGVENFKRLESTYGSSDNERSLALSGAQVLGRWVVRGSAGRRDFDDVNGGGDLGEQNYTGYKERHAFASALHKLDDGGRWGINFSQSTQIDVPRTDKYINDSERYLFERQARRSFNTFADLPLDALIADNMKVRLERQVQTEHVFRQRFGSDLVRHVHDQVTTDGFNLQFDRSIGQHLLLYGVEVYRDEVDSRGRRSLGGVVQSRSGSFPDDSRYTTAAGFSHLSLSIGERALVDVTLRYSEFRAEASLTDYGKLDERYRDLTGSLRGSYELLPGTRIFAGISSGFRAPNLDDLAVLKSTNEGVDVPSPGLDPEQLINYELGIKHAGKRWQTTFVAFDSRFTDLIERKPGLYRGLTFIDDDGDQIWDPNEDGVVQKFNIGKARMYGLEFDSTTRLTDHVQATLAISYIRGKNEISDEPLSRVPPLQAILSLRREFPASRSWIEGLLHAAKAQHRVSARDAADPRIGIDGTPGFAAVSLNAGTRVGKRHQVALSLNNLLDQKHKMHGSGVYEPGRSVKISYALEL